MAEPTKIVVHFDDDTEIEITYDEEEDGWRGSHDPNYIDFLGPIVEDAIDHKQL